MRASGVSMSDASAKGISMTSPPSFSVLAAGDRFIRPVIFREEIVARLGSRVAVTELELPWPDEPFGAVAEVNEASGGEDQLIEALRGHRGLVTQLAPITERVLAAAPDLEFIGVGRGGPTNINIDAAAARGIRVVNVPGRNGVATAEMTLGLLLAALRRLPILHGSLLRHEWRGEFYRYEQVGREVAGSTVALLGAGAVGQHLARILVAMGADVVVYDPYLPAGALPQARRCDDLDELFASCDVLSLHARLNRETEHVVNARRLALMRAGAVVVNAARGGLMDYDAVADALEAGRLGGVALDVFPTEPVDMALPLLKLAQEDANVVLAPHVAGASRETARRAAAGAAEELRRHLDGEPALHGVRSGVMA
ncbi:NAD(P)-dependent oxidoreductase [Streptomyces sp. NPDC059255]|uniref:NAD(P)-dependent oxidoreductase n=1 Tax=Streptomyces sp. NPDC059255 TaxID=3346793 RepID=UPI00369EFBBC